MEYKLSTTQLTTTSYAILGALALRPWSAYELTAYMRMSAIRAVWPRTESRLYGEPKNLVAHGFAKATREFTKRRGRTVYRITAAGRKALQAWLSERPALPQLEDEAMLKLALADQGTREQALATIQAGLEDLHNLMTELLSLAHAVSEGKGRFPERRHISAISARHSLGRLRARLDFLKWAHAWIREWNGTALDDAKLTQINAMAQPKELERMEEELREFLRSIGGKLAEPAAASPDGRR
jgi:DNA-binding PadR family transcriptional regulator